ncbi:indolepyruvate oxidoreductase subunit beta [Myxococcota bacterium]|nr:indolepyruvate oxidoreductase subunit beta [Myxococcota bacterium]MBU1430863.1 indolepyruvate oxidoreductase subunit beta [Myxococcota bacterium]MBU1899336.1 indolepyruvate oxidoreductase subunit beta [Myxococcota bacterium]
MKFDIILAGVGGQGVLSLSAIIANAALRAGLNVKQAEVHGMSQRGGAVMADLRLSDGPIHSSTIPRGRAQLILSMEPLESLRYVAFLAPGGRLLTAADPVINIPNYPPLAEVLAAVEAVPGGRHIDALSLAKEAGSARATNVVMAGAASSILPLSSETLEAFIAEMFARKGDKVVEANARAFRAGREAAR